MNHTFLLSIDMAICDMTCQDLDVMLRNITYNCFAAVGMVLAMIVTIRLISTTSLLLPLPLG
jgi:hypothetical protein